MGEVTYDRTGFVGPFRWEKAGFWDLDLLEAACYESEICDFLNASVTMSHTMRETLNLNPQLSKLPASVIDFLEEKASLVEVNEGDFLFREGDLGTNLMVLRSGSLEAYQLGNVGKQVLLRRFEPGTLIGLTSFFTDGQRSASIKACSAVQVWSIPGEALKEFMFPSNSDGQVLSKALISLLSQKVRHKNQQLADRDSQPSSGKLKVAFFDSQSYMSAPFSEAGADQLDFSFIENRLSVETAYNAVGHEVVCSFVNDSIDEKVAEILSDCGVKLIALRCAGFNHVDLAACERLGISVVRVPAYSPYAVAEHATAMLLCLNRRLHRAYNRVREGNFTLDELVGFDLHGKSVGVIGTGKIGSAFARQMHGFGAKVQAYDLYPQEDLVSSGILSYVELDKIFEDSDVISLHTPLLPETHHLVNRETIGKMKKGVYIVNTSRGGLVDTVALINGLKEKHIGGAALDVYEEEADYFFQDKSADVISDDTLARLLTFNNVLVTSHQAFMTEDALNKITEVTLSNIAEFEKGLRGAELTNSVQCPS